MANSFLLIFPLSIAESLVNSPSTNFPFSVPTRPFLLPDASFSSISLVAAALLCSALFFIFSNCLSRSAVALDTSPSSFLTILGSAASPASDLYFAKLASAASTFACLPGRAADIFSKSPLNCLDVLVGVAPVSPVNLTSTSISTSEPIDVTALILVPSFPSPAIVATPTPALLTSAPDIFPPEASPINELNPAAILADCVPELSILAPAPTSLDLTGAISTGLLDDTSTGLLGVVSTGLLDATSTGLPGVVSTGLLDVTSTGLLSVVSTGLLDATSTGLLGITSVGFFVVVSTGLLDDTSTGLLGVVSVGFFGVVSTGLLDVTSTGLLGVVSVGFFVVVSTGLLDVTSTGLLGVVSVGFFVVVSLTFLEEVSAADDAATSLETASAEFS